MIAPRHPMLVLAAPLLLGGCMTNPPMPERPVLSCNDCSGLTYYGPQQAPAEAPGVSLARVLVGGAARIAAYGFAADTAKSVAGALADAGRVQVVDQPAPTIVDQPAPTIVDQPAPTIVEPAVVTQPPPLIVQPQVVSPEIVQPAGTTVGP